MNKPYTNVLIKNGTFYLSSKTPQEGFTEIEVKNPTTGEMLTRYHKELWIEGKFSGATEKEDTYKGKGINVYVEAEEEIFALFIPLVGTGRIKSTDQYLNSCIGSLLQLNVGDEVKMFVNNDRKDTNGRLYKNIIILRDGALVKSSYSYSDVPKWEKTETKDTFGEVTTTWDPTETNKFYLNIFNQVIEKFKKKDKTGGQKAESKPTKTKPETKKEEAAKTEAPPQSPAAAFSDDDLPF